MERGRRGREKEKGRGGKERGREQGGKGREGEGERKEGDRRRREIRKTKEGGREVLNYSLPNLLSGVSF